MPDLNNVIHYPAQYEDGALDFFNRKAAFGVIVAAAPTGLINATALPAAATIWNTSSAITLGAVATATYTKSSQCPLATVNQTYKNTSGWQIPTPRTLQYVCSGAQTGQVTVTGLDRYGVTRTETITLNGATPVLGLIPFEWVFTVVVPAKVAAETFSLGTSTGIGLPYPPLDPDSGLRAYIDTAFTKDTSAGTIDATNYTWTPATAPNGTRNYTLIYQSIR